MATSPVQVYNAGDVNSEVYFLVAPDGTPTPVQRFAGAESALPEKTAPAASLIFSDGKKAVYVDENGRHAAEVNWFNGVSKTWEDMARNTVPAPNFRLPDDPPSVIDVSNAAPTVGATATITAPAPGKTVPDAPAAAVSAAPPVAASSALPGLANAVKPQAVQLAANDFSVAGTASPPTPAASAAPAFDPAAPGQPVTASPVEPPLVPVKFTPLPQDPAMFTPTGPAEVVGSAEPAQAETPKPSLLAQAKGVLYSAVSSIAPAAAAHTATEATATAPKPNLAASISPTLAGSNVMAQPVNTKPTTPLPEVAVAPPPPVVNAIAQPDIIKAGEKPAYVAKPDIIGEGQNPTVVTAKPYFIKNPGDVLPEPVKQPAQGRTATEGERTAQDTPATEGGHTARDTPSTKAQDNCELPAKPNTYEQNLELQAMLKKEGHYDGKLDGVAGDETKRAFRDFIDDYNKTNGTKLDPNNMSVGSEGAKALTKAYQLDTGLNGLDGKLGPETRRAIETDPRVNEAVHHMHSHGHAAHGGHHHPGSELAQPAPCPDASMSFVGSSVPSKGH